MRCASSFFAALLATQYGRQVVVWVGRVGLCIRVHLISVSLSSQAERNKEWEATKRIHGLVRKPFMQTVRHECKMAAVIKWMWCEINACHSVFWDERGKERERWKRARERKKKNMRRRKIKTKWHPVKSKKIVLWTELNLSATLSEMKGDFDKIISFHLFLSLSALLRCLHSFYAPPFYLTSFCVWSPVCCFLSWLGEKDTGGINLHVVSLFIIKSAGVHKKTIEFKLTFYLTHQKPVNWKYNHNIFREKWYFVDKMKYNVQFQTFKCLKCSCSQITDCVSGKSW